ncbi:MAG: type II secretion system protein GspM [Pacificimonas sp.]
MTGLAPYWTARSLRERRMLAALGVIFAVFLLWFAVIRPLGLWIDESTARLLTATEDHAEAEAIVARLGQARSAATPDALDALLEEAGLTGTVASDGGRQSVEIAAIRPDVLFSLIAAIERRIGAPVTSVSIRRNDDATVEASLVVGGN